MGMLQEKVAIITGASSGIGRAAALLFAAEGAAVILNARSTPDLDKVADTIRGQGGRAHIVAGDISRPETHDQPDFSLHGKSQPDPRYPGKRRWLNHIHI